MPTNLSSSLMCSISELSSSVSSSLSWDIVESMLSMLSRLFILSLLCGRPRLNLKAPFIVASAGHSCCGIEQRIGIDQKYMQEHAPREGILASRKNEAKHKFDLRSASLISKS
jgi:hypothetical protein